MTAWTAEMREEAVARQLALIEGRDVPMAVVDYGLGWRRTGASSRFGVRDLRHVAMYGLTVVVLNAAARPDPDLHQRLADERSE